MATVRVGVKRAVDVTGQEPDVVGAEGVEYTQQWVEVDGFRIDGDRFTSVEYGVDEPGGSGVITVRLLSHGFSTVDHRVGQVVADVDEALLRSTTSAKVWADEFAKVYPQVDKATMIGWFANAMQTAMAIQAGATR